MSYQESEKEKGDRENRGLDGAKKIHSGKKRDKKGPENWTKTGWKVGPMLATIKETGDLTLKRQKQAQQRDGYSNVLILADFIYLVVNI